MVMIWMNATLFTIPKLGIKQEIHFLLHEIRITQSTAHVYMHAAFSISAKLSHLPTKKSKKKEKKNQRKQFFGKAKKVQEVLKKTEHIYDENLNARNSSHTDTPT